MKNLNNLILAGCIFFFAVLGCSKPETGGSVVNTTVNNNGTTNARRDGSSNTANINAVANEPKQTQAENIKWSDYDRIYNVKSNSTDMQKDALWDKFKGKSVTWQGTVTEVSEGMLGGLKINIKMNPDTLTNDILLNLKDSEKEKMMSLTKGKKITFSGKLANYGGAVMPLTIDEGEIK